MAISLGHNGNTITKESTVEKLEWPISEELLGRKVKYLGSIYPTLFNFTVGKTYTITKKAYHDIQVSLSSDHNLKPVMYGPLDDEGDMPWNQGPMDFELLPEEE